MAAQSGGRTERRGAERTRQVRGVAGIDEAAHAGFDAAAEIKRAREHRGVRRRRQAGDADQRLRELDGEAGIAGDGRGVGRFFGGARPTRDRGRAPTKSGHARIRNRFRLSRLVTCAHS